MLCTMLSGWHLHFVLLLWAVRRYTLHFTNGRCTPVMCFIHDTSSLFEISRKYDTFRGEKLCSFPLQLLADKKQFHYLKTWQNILQDIMDRSHFHITLFPTNRFETWSFSECNQESCAVQEPLFIYLCNASNRAMRRQFDVQARSQNVPAVDRPPRVQNWHDNGHSPYQMDNFSKLSTMILASFEVTCRVN